MIEQKSSALCTHYALSCKRQREFTFRTWHIFSTGRSLTFLGSWNNIKKRLAALLLSPLWVWEAPLTSVKQWQFWSKQWSSHSARCHNCCECVSLSTHVSSWGQSSDSNSSVRPTSPCMLWGGGHAWGKPGFHSQKAKRSSLVGFSTHKNWHKLCASG